MLFPAFCCTHERKHRQTIARKISSNEIWFTSFWSSLGLSIILFEAGLSMSLSIRLFMPANPWPNICIINYSSDPKPVVLTSIALCAAPKWRPCLENFSFSRWLVLKLEFRGYNFCIFEIFELTKGLEVVFPSSLVLFQESRNEQHLLRQVVWYRILQYSKKRI